MMPSSDFNFTDGISGYVAYTPPFTYNVATGYVNVRVDYNSASNKETRGFMQFDTAALPDTATVTKVELFVVEAAVQPMIPPDEVKIYIGTWIGTSLDASSADYTGGTSMAFDILSYGSGVWIDLSDGGLDPTGYVSLTGKTDIALRPFYSGLTTLGRAYNQAKSKCQLRVTYRLAGKGLPLVGVGR